MKQIPHTVFERIFQFEPAYGIFQFLQRYLVNARISLMGADSQYQITGFHLCRQLRAEPSDLFEHGFAFFRCNIFAESPYLILRNHNVETFKQFSPGTAVLCQSQFHSQACGSPACRMKRNQIFAFLL